MMKNYKIVLQYDGTRYDGWQKQGNTANTIQGKLEYILERMTGCLVEVHGAGRTDAGVHAEGQVANFRIEGQWNPQKIREYLNHYLPEDIEVIHIQEVPERFHSRLHAIGKTYVYRIAVGGAKHVFERRQFWTVEEPLNIRAMRQAAEILEGCHDFKSFCANKRMKKSTVRTLQSISIEELPGELRLVFQGDGFLYHMVRILTGTLLEVGKGTYGPEHVEEILKSCSREMAGPCVPARGLCLREVRY